MVIATTRASIVIGKWPRRAQKTRISASNVVSRQNHVRRDGLTEPRDVTGSTAREARPPGGKRDAILAWGNPFRGEDGVAWQVACTLQDG